MRRAPNNPAVQFAIFIMFPLHIVVSIESATCYTYCIFC